MVAEPMGRVTTMKRIMNTESAKTERRAKRNPKKKWSKQQHAFYSATRKAQREGQPLPLTQEVLDLHAQGKSRYEISKLLKISENAVFTRIERAPKPSNVMTIPAEAIPPRREMPVRRYKRRELPVTGNGASRAMRVVVKAGSEITVTIGGVEVQIVAEGR